VLLHTSKYVHTVEGRHGHLVFNSLTLETFELDDAESRALARFRSACEVAPDDDPVVSGLWEAGLIVESGQQDGLLALDRLRESRAQSARGRKGRHGTLRMALTERCNMACSYCFQQQMYPDAQPTMSAELLRDTMEWFIGQADGGRVTVQYFGGEPMLEWDRIVEADGMLQEARAAGRISDVRQTITTNGTVMTAAKARWMVDRDFDLTFSFDGPPDVNDRERRLRSGRGTYDLAARGLRTWVEAGGTSSLLMTATRSNVRHLPEYVRWFAEESGLEPKVIGINSPQPVETGWETGGVELAEAIWAVWRFCDENDIFFHGPGTSLPTHITDRAPHTDNCVDTSMAGEPAMWPVYVSADGRRSLCVVHHRDHRVEVEADESAIARTREWHFGQPTVNECDTCIASQLCGGPCTLERIMWGGRLSQDRCGFMREMTRLVLTEG
jgi:uncharacterized protein